MKLINNNRFYLQKRDLLYLSKCDKSSEKYKCLINKLVCNVDDLNDFIYVSDRQFIDYINQYDILNYDEYKDLNLIEIVLLIEGLLKENYDSVILSYRIESFKWLLNVFDKKDYIELPLFMTVDFMHSDVRMGGIIMSTNIRNNFLVRFSDEHDEFTEDDWKFVIEGLNKAYNQGKCSKILSELVFIERKLNNGFLLLSVDDLNKKESFKYVLKKHEGIF